MQKRGMDILDCLAFFCGNGEGADFWRSAVSGYDCRLFGFVFFEKFEKTVYKREFHENKEIKGQKDSKKGKG